MASDLLMCPAVVVEVSGQYCPPNRNIIHLEDCSAAAFNLEKDFVFRSEDAGHQYCYRSSDTQRVHFNQHHPAAETAAQGVTSLCWSAGVLTNISCAVLFLLHCM